MVGSDGWLPTRGLLSREHVPFFLMYAWTLQQVNGAGVLVALELPVGRWCRVLASTVGSIFVSLRILSTMGSFLPFFPFVLFWFTDIRVLLLREDTAVCVVRCLCANSWLEQQSKGGFMLTTVYLRRRWESAANRGRLMGSVSTTNSCARCGKKYGRARKECYGTDVKAMCAWLPLCWCGVVL